MQLLQALAHLLSAGSQSQKPDITYNPNPNTNIPYSAHTPQVAQLGNQYTSDPTAPQFLGVDPRAFGYPADNTARPPMHQLLQGGTGIRQQPQNIQLQGGRSPQAPANLPIGGFQHAGNPMPQANRPLRVNNSDFSGTQIRL